MTDHRASLVEPAEHLPAGTADRFGSRNARQRLKLLVPRVDAEVGPELHQRVAGAKDRGHLAGTLGEGAAMVERPFTVPRELKIRGRPTPSSSDGRPLDGRRWRVVLARCKTQPRCSLSARKRSGGGWRLRLPCGRRRL